MFIIKIYHKDGKIKLYNNPSYVYFNPNYKYDNLKPGALHINDGSGLNSITVSQDDTQTPLDLLYGKIEKSIEKGGMVTIYLNK